jgi:predicted nucleotidyltransferase
MVLNKHNQMINKVLQFVENDDRIAGLALGGSYITNSMDEFSDLDFVVVTKTESYKEIMSERLNIVKHFGKLLSAFTGEHVGEPRLVICLYASPLLHVDFKFVSIDDSSHRIENPTILYQDDNCLSKAFMKETAVFPIPKLQWIEDRFWVWIHYAATKIARGELFEVIDFLSFLRQVVISPLLQMKNGKLPRGVRKIEMDIPNEIDALKKTIAIHEISSCISAVQASIDLYIALRECHRHVGFYQHDEAETIAIEFFNEIAKSEGNNCGFC